MASATSSSLLYSRDKLRGIEVLAISNFRPKHPMTEVDPHGFRPPLLDFHAAVIPQGIEGRAHSQLDAEYESLIYVLSGSWSNLNSAEGQITLRIDIAAGSTT